MKEETGRHLNCLDGWRGMALLAVLAGHFALDHIKPGVSILGVNIFFVLSGRLMAEILFVRRAPLPTFFLRRFSRVYPGLVFYVLGVSALFFFTPYRHGIAAMGAALTFTLNYAMVFGHPVALLDHLWSLCVEEHSYVLLALVALVVRPRSWSPLVLILGIALLAAANAAVQTALPHRDYFAVYWRTDVQLWPIFIAAATHLAIRDRPAFHKPWIAPASLLAGVVASLYAPGDFARYVLGGAFLALAVCTLEHSAAAVRGVFEVRGLRRLGLWSYSLYLWQQPFYKLNNDQVAPPPVLLAAAFALAMLSYYGVEKPFRGVLNRHGQVIVDRLFGRQAPGVPPGSGPAAAPAQDVDGRRRQATPR